MGKTGKPVFHGETGKPVFHGVSAFAKTREQQTFYFKTLIFTKQVNKFYFRPNWQAVVAEASFEENDQEDFGAVVWKKGDDLDAFDVDSNNEESFDAGNYDFPFPNPDAVMLGYLGPAESW